jgi:hypothetical protein
VAVWLVILVWLPRQRARDLARTSRAQAAAQSQLDADRPAD